MGKSCGSVQRNRRLFMRIPLCISDTISIIIGIRSVTKNAHVEHDTSVLFDHN